MADPFVEIEVQLRRAVVTPEQMIERRKKLLAIFAALSQDEAVDMMSRLFTWDNSRLPRDFRTLHRDFRLELVNVLAAKLGAQAAENFKAAFQGRTQTKLLDGLKLIFPDDARTQRDAFLKSLDRGKPTGNPAVVLQFRNQGKFSPDNRAPALVKGGMIDALGPVKGLAINHMEIRGIVSNHRPDAEYMFDRTVNSKDWYLSGKVWKPLSPPLPPGTPDNSHSNDEDDFPDNDHIYSLDTPGPAGPETAPNSLERVPFNERTDVTQIVFMMNASETVSFRVAGGPWKQAGQLDWFSVSWLEKVDGKWRRRPSANAIAAGSIENLENAANPDDTRF